MEFSQIVKSLRLERGWSQQEVADRAGLNKMTISQYENGKRKPSFEVIEALAEIFHVDMNYLLGYTDKIEKPVSNAVVYRMLRNEKYLGEFYIQDVKLNVEPIIDQATFLEAARHFKTSRNNAAGRAKVNYLLSCKMFCGYCGSMISAEAGTGKLGKVYRYYKCGDKKRGKKCELKPFPKDHLEDAIILATVNDMLTDEMIEKLTVRILEVQEQENADDPVVGLRRRLDSNKKRQRNLLDAIEEGGARGLVSRLAALEEEEEQLVLEIQRAEIKRPRLTHEVVEAWLRSFRVGDVTDDDFRARLVDTFIARVELRNDEALIFYNIREKGPHSRVRVRPEWWSPRDGTRTPKIIVLRDYVVLRIAV